MQQVELNKSRGFTIIEVSFLGMMALLIVSMAYVLITQPHGTNHQTVTPTGTISPVQSSDTPAVELPTHDVLEANSLSSTYIYGSETDRVKVYLYAEDQTTRAPAAVSCQNPRPHMQHSEGNFTLILDPATALPVDSEHEWPVTRIDIGQKSFVEDTLWDGQINAIQLDPNGYPSMIQIWQSSGCNHQMLWIYGLNTTTQTFELVRFEKDAELISSILVSPGSFAINNDYQITVSEYHQTDQQDYFTRWYYDAETHAFKVDEQWSEPCCN